MENKKEEFKGFVTFENLDGLADLIGKLSNDLRTIQKDCEAINNYEVELKIGQ